ncbi:MAG: ATP-binding protein [Spirochaetia bacterium]
MNNSNTILYVDDEFFNLNSFRITFEDNFNVVTCRSAEEALETLEKIGEVPLIITDQRMPGLTGIELLKKLNDLYPDTVKILLTAYADVNNLLEAINWVGVYSYIVKPWREDSVRRIIFEAFEKYYLVKENKRLICELKEHIERMQRMQESLIRHEKMAIIGKLTAGLSHEIRNQLTPISLLSEFAHELNEDQKESVGCIVNSRDRILNLVQEICAITRDEDIDVPFDYIDIESTVSEAIFIAKLDLDTRPINIYQQFDYRGRVYGNKNKIIQVILNLLRNAAYAVRNNDRKIIRVIVDEQDDFAVVHIIDNGCGIAEKYLQKIWDTFFTTKGEDGTGIGLEVCRNIVHAHGGRITCFNNESAGATFQFTIPLTEQR